MWILITAVVSASLLGSMHCVGMCGPLALWAGGAGEQLPRSRRTLAVTCYHLGRLVTYLTAGALAGFVGQIADQTGTLLGVQLLAARIVGLLMIALGGLQLVRILASGRPKAITANAQPSFVARALAYLRPYVSRLPLIARGWAAGLLTALLPCGWLYVFALVAAGSGNWLTGAVVMLAFWLGTVPALVSLLIGTQLLARRWQRIVPAGVAALLVLGGCYTAAGRGFAQLHSLTDIRAPVQVSRQGENSMAYPLDPGASIQNPTGQNPREASVREQIERLVDVPLPCCVQSTQGEQTP